MMNPSARACGADETDPNRARRTEKANNRFMRGWTEAGREMLHKNFRTLPLRELAAAAPMRVVNRGVDGR